MNNLILISKDVLRRTSLLCYNILELITPSINKITLNRTFSIRHYTAIQSLIKAYPSIFPILNVYDLHTKKKSEIKSFDQEQTIITEMCHGGYCYPVIYFETWLKNNIKWRPNLKFVESRDD